MFLVAGLIGIAGGVYGYIDSRAPHVVSNQDWQAGRLPTAPAYVRLSAEPDVTGALYNLRRNSDIREQTERLTKQSTANGIPLTGPEGISPAERSQLVGTLVCVRAKALVDEKNTATFSRKTQVSLTGSSVIDLILLARLQVDEPLCHVLRGPAPAMLERSRH